MAKSLYTSALEKDFKRKKGEIKDLRKDLKELCRLIQSKEKELKALETILRSHDPDFDPNHIKAVATRPKVSGIKWNGLTKAVLGCLREAAGESVRSDVITDYVIETTNAVVKDRKDLVVMRRCVKDTLKRLHRKGQLVRHHQTYENKLGIWSLNPDYQAAN